MPSTYKVCSPPQVSDDFPMVSSLIDKETRRWRADLIRTLFLPFEADTILRIPLSYSLPDDYIVWIGNRRSEFSVKSVYYVALPIVENLEGGESSNGDTRTPLWKKMWQLKIPPKVRIFAWRVCMNGLTNLLNLGRRRINNDVLALYIGRSRKVQYMLYFFVKRYGRYGGIGRHALLVTS